MHKDKLTLSSTTFSFKKSLLSKKVFKNIKTSFVKKEIDIKGFSETLTKFYYPLINEYNLIFIQKFSSRLTKKIVRLKTCDDMMLLKFKLTFLHDAVTNRKLETDLKKYYFRTIFFNYLIETCPNEPTEQHEQLLNVLLDKTQREDNFLDIVLTTLESKIELLNVKINAFNFLRKTIIQYPLEEIKQSKEKKL